MKLRIYPYKMSSTSAKKLAQALQCLRIRERGNYRHFNNHIVINWGNTHLPNWYNGNNQPLNHPNDVAKACNKLLTFEYLEDADVSVPSFVTNTELAQVLIDEGHRVYGRKLLTSNSGQGIIVFEPGTQITPEQSCPLYTKNVKAKYEYRVHVAGGNIIDFCQKKKRSDITEEQRQFFNPAIRSHSFGWVFCRDNIVLPEIVKEQAIKAITALGLSFGAVDIGYNQHENKAYVYEVNTAPGLEGTTLTKYTEYFLSLLRS